ncbi:unnamed protein product [Amoebophrya sp. A25]|nr:unnamed protein product [Amoebophrya sp. A25]|eukprot:GSA25T00003027001.1
MSRTTTTAPDVGDAVYHKASGRNGIVKRVGKKHLRISFEDVAAEVSKNEWVSTAELEMVVREVVRRTGGQHGGGDVEYEAEGAKLKKRKVEASRSVEDEQPAELTTQVQKVKAKGSTSNSMNTRPQHDKAKITTRILLLRKVKGKAKQVLLKCVIIADVSGIVRRIVSTALNCPNGFYAVPLRQHGVRQRKSVVHALQLKVKVIVHISLFSTILAAFPVNS